MKRHAVVAAGLGLAVVSSGLVGQSAASATTPSAPSTTTITTPAGPCSAFKAPGRVQTVRGQTTASVRVARAILVDTVTCDRRDLVRRASRDHTRLSFGTVTPAQNFRLPDRDAKYAALARALTRTKPSYDRESRSYTWPRVAGNAYRDPAAWREAVRAGLITERQSRDMQESGTGYMGWRLSISSNGTWQNFVAGD